MAESVNNLEDLKNRFEELRSTSWRINFAEKEKEIEKIKTEMSEPNFWQNREEAEKKSERLGKLKEEFGKWEILEQKVNQLTSQSEQKILKQIEREIADMEKLTYFIGPYDQNNALLSIHAGAGGTDAQDWAEMLRRMYLRFCQNKGWVTRVIDESFGGEAGIKSATIEIEGDYAYGFLKGESGVHRLVRISPFDAGKMRHTSFALVQVMPELEDVKVEIKPEDLKIDTFLSSSKGGQNVQKTETAVRITHWPTKITVACQAERSQLQNKERAMKILKSKIYQYYQAKQDDEKAVLRGELKINCLG